MAVMSSLRDTTKELLARTKLALTTISNDSGVSYHALYYFKTKGEDMKSEDMQKLYEYLSGKQLDVSNEG